MYLFLLKQVCRRGGSVHRAFLDYHLEQLKLEGDILDLGSGKHDMYRDFIPRDKERKYDIFDNKRGEGFIDFEKDTLPYQDGSYDTVLLLNVLEHIYNHRHLLQEVRRVKRGRLVGSVPFIKWYHADPHDYYRYTHEALERILAECGYTDISIKPLVLGAYCTAFEQVRPTLPRILWPFMFSLCYGLDAIYRRLRPTNSQRYVLDYLFTCR